MLRKECSDPSLPLGLCGCGQLLYPSLDEAGNRRGVTHLTAEEDEYHCLYFSGMRVSIDRRT